MTIKKIMGGEKSYKPFEDCLEKIKKPKELKVTEFKPFGSIPIISQEINFISGYTNDENFRFCAPRDLVIFGDHTRVLKYIDFDFAVGADGVKILVPKSFLSVKYFYYFLKWCNVDNLGYSRHYKLLKEIKVYVPPMEVQEEIVKELDLINRLLEIKQEEIKQLDLLSQSIFYSMFGDPITNENNFPIAKLGDVCENLHGIWKGKKTKLVNVGVIRNANFTKDFKLDYSKIEYIDVDADAFAKRYLQNGDLIVEKSGGTNKQPVGRAILYEGKNGVYSFSNFTMVLRIKHNDIINSKYLYYTLKLLYLMGITRQMQTQTTGLRNLILDRYLSLQISLPPMEEQKRFAEKIEKIEELKVKAKKQIEDIKEMLNYSMDKYFG